jgi:hypothetical protein
MVDGKRVRAATVELLLAELARRHVADQVRIPCGGEFGSFVQYPSAEAALRGLSAASEREEADDLAISRAMASNVQIGMREAKRNPPPLARNQF